jgi:hypothetical protein
MQALMVRLAEASRLMPCLPGIGQSMATTRQVGDGRVARAVRGPP